MWESPDDLDDDAVCPSWSGMRARSIEISDRVPAGVSTVLAQLANRAVAGAGSESAANGVERKGRDLVAGERLPHYLTPKTLRIPLR